MWSNLPSNEKPKWLSLPTLFVQAALVAAAGVLALILITKYIAPIPLSISQVTTQKQAAFNVTGKSTVSTVPDKVEVSLGINSKGADLKQAKDTADTIINTITQKMLGLGMKKEDIKTENYSIYPNYDYQTTGQNITGYSVNISMRISTTDFTKLNQIVDMATASGANQVSGIQFSLSDQKQKEVQQQARVEAIQDAKNNADQLANLSGMKLGKIINIVEGGMPPSPIPYMAMDALKVGVTANGSPVAPTNITPGSTTYTYTVTLSYETL